MSWIGARECPGRCATRSCIQFTLLVAAASTFLAILNPTNASALCFNPPCPDAGNANLAASSALFDVNDRFLNSLIQHAGSRSAVWSDAAGNSSLADRFSPLAYGANEPSRGKASDNPLAAYAAAPAPPDPRYRTWFEGYGSRSHTDAQGTFNGDTRRVFGGVAGIGYTLAPGVSVGASVDQGHTKTDVNGGTQSSRMDMTQIGVNAAFYSGPWTLSVAGVYGFGRIHSARLESLGEAAAGYGTHMWGAIAELSYYWSSGHWRVVPKAGFDGSLGTTDAYVESGGTTPVSGSAQTTKRARAYAALEVGYTNNLNNKMNYDISVYGKVIDIFSQDVPALLVTPLSGATAFLVPGLNDARVEFATGASLGVRLASNMRVYVNYDGRFRSDFDSHAGMAGVEFRW